MYAVVIGKLAGCEVVKTLKVKANKFFIKIKSNYFKLIWTDSRCSVFFESKQQLLEVSERKRQTEISQYLVNP